MDPDAHIDLVAVPNDRLDAFDLAYAYIAQYLDTGQVEGLAGTPVHIFSGPADQAAFYISITSNSHAFYSTEVSYLAAPFDVLVQEELVDILAAHGVTEFFATGDFGSHNGGTVLQASRPTEAAGAVSVGGGMVTAEDNGIEFPVTGIITSIDGASMNVATATGIGGYTYWSAFGGAVGGTYAQSIIVQRQWWENALDTYSTTGIIQPVVSNAAAFNITLYDHGWQLFYGGTSFATPITAGEFGLIEEQVAYSGISPMLGNANPLFFEAHNVYEQGIYRLDPYQPMQNIGVGWTWAPYNSYDWNHLNTTEEYPQYQNLPSWYSTIFNPAGNGWTFLGGLGMPGASIFAYIHNQIL
jgi:subtilase family serine protease